MKPFNVRVYALLEHNGKVLVMHEPFQGKLIYKFPGGGLEFGEGTKDCLVREFKEELNLDVEITSHFYTQDFFVLNAFDPTEQVLLIYYKATITDKALANLKILDADIEELLWIEPKQLKATKFTLEADKVVVDLYKKENFES
ncbi:ADP-ribose pyrophosphatase YjhB, NUDIX family [Algoriella xinjiangensis]|uniref:ADP-ribose pyrophosphatase YjhB, NUDIX family n=1 Tax=Algoriella xinjiangensis TaxID=684065 RepID=A0A1I4Z8D4_9FLAO|nr:NUDIX domain-containing protein [Algoriella xinjiangensis]SFN46130.1 ADP-ribose pyrophosphatase YjhB, NUDIX family [Algoriella xinjiangensis]VDH16488.1 mutator mutT protein [Algoriella xinjiangensis]